MEFDGSNYHALLHGFVIQKPELVGILRSIFYAYEKNEPFEEYIAQLDSDVASKVRFIIQSLNEIDDPETLDVELLLIFDSLHRHEAEISLL